MGSYCPAQEMAYMHFMYGHANGNFQEASMQNIIHNAESHPTNYSPHIMSD
jgi:hypothetical protein